MALKHLTNIDMNQNQILNMSPQQLASDPGSPFTGQVWLNTTTNLVKYYNGSSIIVLYDAATTNTASKLALRDSSGNFSANVITVNSITISNTPVSSTDGATKGYVDSVAQGLSPKPSAYCTSQSALPANTYANGSSGVGATLTANANGTLTIDGQTPAVGNYILVNGEATQSHNGLYQMTTLGDGSHAYVLTRAVEMDASVEFTGTNGSASYVFIENGTTYAKTGWIYTGAASPTVGTTAITFAQFTGAGDLTFNTPFSASGNVVSLNLNPRLVNNSGNLDLASGIVAAGTYYGQITVDTYGRVTSGADLSSSNGAVTRTAAGTFTSRTMTGTAGTITITNGDGVAGNPTFTISASYVGQTSITTLGTITTGTWTGTNIAVANGGTGSSTATGARSNLGATGKYTALIGDGVTTAIAITQATHGLASDGSMHAHCFDASTGALVFPDVTINNSNGTVTFTFATAPATNAYRIVLIG